jgi:hypothetical protein
VDKQIQNNNWLEGLLAIAAVGGGFALSLIGFGLLWIGTPWHYQMLMFLPFLLLSWAVTRTLKEKGMYALVLIAGGAGPIGAIIPLFRDKNDSHLMSILIVCAWVGGMLVGYYLGRQRRSRA